MVLSFGISSRDCRANNARVTEIIMKELIRLLSQDVRLTSKDGRFELFFDGRQYWVTDKFDTSKPTTKTASLEIALFKFKEESGIM
jgi:hypothetical protein